MPLVRTKHGLMADGKARALEAFEESRRRRVVEEARVRVESRAESLGISPALVKSLWANGEELLQRRLAEIKKIVSKPNAEIEKAYPCAGCAILYDDEYKASCASLKVAPCFIQSVLKGCPSLIPRSVVAGYARAIPSIATPGANQ